MRVAIIGAGFSGLGLAWHLLKNSACEVTLFDAKGIGGGASGMAAGLLHPYVGEEGRRSLFATEGIASTKELIAVAEKSLEASLSRPGILRYPLDEEKIQLFHSHSKEFGDVQFLGGGCFEITSGLTVDCPLYLQGLWQAISERGGKLILQEISDLESLKDFDQIVLAAGAGVSKLIPNWGHYSILKGQVLICKAPEAISLPEKSTIGKGYLALGLSEKVCHIGSTYERGKVDEHPDPVFAKENLFSKLAPVFPEIERLEVISCKAALRVIRRGHYFPIADKIREGLWAITAMGSRGLLYHGLLAERLSQAILEQNVCRQNFSF